MHSPPPFGLGALPTMILSLLAALRFCLIGPSIF
jgi:hypothetical protein